MGIKILKNFLKKESFERTEKLSNIKFKTTFNIKIGSQPAKDPNFILEKGLVIIEIDLSLLSEKDEEKIGYTATYMIEYEESETKKVDEFNTEIFSIVSDEIFNHIEYTFHTAGIKDYKIKRFKLSETDK